jgi:hypothetical protein
MSRVKWCHLDRRTYPSPFMEGMVNGSRRLSLVHSTPIASRRCLMVAIDSLAARIPLPGVAMALAMR